MIPVIAFLQNDQHDRLVQFLEDHENLDELTRIPTILYEPIVMTMKDRIKIAEFGTRIDSFVKLEGGLGLEIGKGVHIASFAHLGIGGGTTVLENYTAVASGGKLISGSNQTDAWSMSAVAPELLQKRGTSFVLLKECSCVLTNAVVLPGVTLHEGAILAAGAVATKDIPAWEIWGGVPAKHLARRVPR